MRSPTDSNEFETQQARPTTQYSEGTVPLLPSDPLAEDPTPTVPCIEGQSLTLRAITVGLAIGTLACFSNSYFGLQTGWISMMNLPLSLIGFAVFKAFSQQLSYPFLPVENVLVQTVAVGVGTMPLAAGLVGVIPVLEKLLDPWEGGPLHLNWGLLSLWSLGVAFFGVFLAVPLRRQVITREKYPRLHTWNTDIRLRFPSGHATATIISVLHDSAHLEPQQSSPGKRKFTHCWHRSVSHPHMYCLMGRELLMIRQSFPTFSQSSLPYLFSRSTSNEITYGLCLFRLLT